MKFIGRQINVGISKEKTRGVAETSVSIWQPKTDLSFQPRIKTIIDESSVGNIVDGTDMYLVEKSGEGDIAGIIEPNSIGYYLLGIFGKVATTSPENGVYKHQFTLQNSNTTQSFTLFVNDPNGGTKAYPLATLDSLTLTFEKGNFSKFKATFKSKEGENSNVSVSYDVPLTKFNSANESVFKYADNISDLENNRNTTTVCLKNFEITFNKNVEADYCLGNISPTDYINKQFSIEGSFTSVYDDKEIENIILDGDKKAIGFTIEDKNTIIGNSSHPFLQINLALVGFTEFSKTQGNDETVMQTCKFKGLYSQTDGMVGNVILQNTVSSY